MWTLRIAAFVTVAAAIAVWLAQGHIIERYIGMPISGFGLFMIAHPVTKIGMMLLFLMGGLVVMASLIGLFLRPSQKDVRKLTAFEIAISISALAAIGLGALVAGYTEMGIRMAINEVGPVRFEIIAPQKLEQLLTLSLALWPAAIAFGVLLITRAIRARKRLATA